MALATSIVIVANRRASADGALNRVVASLRQRGASVQVDSIWEAGDGVRHARRAFRERVEVVVAAGGDGTLHEVVNGFFEAGSPRGTSVGLLPFGTGNDFARAVGIPLSAPGTAPPLAAVRPPVRIDVARANGEYFINAAAVGYPAELAASARAPAKIAVGRLAYSLSGLKGLTHVKAQNVHIRGHGLSWKGRLVGLGVANGRQAGGGIRFAPGALLNDGLLDVVLIPEKPVTDLLVGVKDIVRPRATGGFRNLVAFQTPELGVESDRPLTFNLDGEARVADRIRFVALRGALPFRLPDPRRSGLFG